MERGINMSIFQTDDSAWSALTKQLEQIAGDPGAPYIVQSPTVFRPWSIAGGTALALFRKFLLGDNQPGYHKLNPTAFVDSARSVQKGYVQYLEALQNELLKRANPVDYDELARLRGLFSTSQTALNVFRRDANKNWKNTKIQNPGASRQDWDDNYCPEGYTPKLAMLQQDVMLRYRAFKAKEAAYPALSRVTQTLYNCEMNAMEQVKLPQSEDDLTYPDSWEVFLRTSVDIGISWDEFFNSDAIQTIEVKSNSTTSSHYDSSWSAGGSFSYGFFSCGGSASGGHVEDHLRSGTQNLKFTFKRLVPLTIRRGAWYDEGLLSPYVSYVDKDEYWGPAGTLNLIPTGALIGRGLTVEIDTSSIAYDAFRDWRRQNGNAGFSFGPWSVGGGANSSTDSSSVSDSSSGTTLRFTDNSRQIYVISVISTKMDDYINAGVRLLQLADSELKQLGERSEQVTKRFKCFSAGS
jgi:hypothetical protein